MPRPRNIKAFRLVTVIRIQWLINTSEKYVEVQENIYHTINKCIFIILKCKTNNLAIYRILELNHSTESATNPWQNWGSQSRT